MCYAADNIHLKILVPSVAAGAIIGKGGESIAQIQRNTGARVKMSKATDFYPGMMSSVVLSSIFENTHTHAYGCVCVMKE